MSFSTNGLQMYWLQVFKANPKMKTVFEEYQNKGLLNSNLEKNQELKQFY
jgi:hypothetical protein